VAVEEGNEGFQFEGVKYRMGSLMLAEARAIQRTTGFTPVQWDEAISKSDAEAITALIWIARKRNGEPNLRFEDVDGDLSTFLPYLEEPEPTAGEADPGKDDLFETPAGPPSAEG
jgi:hypothetical protein